MPRTVAMKGHVVASTRVELERPLPEGVREVEVIARIPGGIGGKLSDYLRSLPPGTRTKEDIDQQIRQERRKWS